MTAKERIRLLIDRLDERRAEVALVLLDRLIAAEEADNGAEASEATEDIGRAENVSGGHLLTSTSPLWGIVGLVDDDGPTDVSENVDKYLAEAYGDLAADDE